MAKIYFLIGKKRQTSILKKILEFNEKETWEEIVLYLDKELRLIEHMLMVNTCHSAMSEGTERIAEDSYHAEVPNDARKCAICDKADHVPTITRRGNKVINYFSCEKFVNMTSKERFEAIKSKHLFPMFESRF